MRIGAVGADDQVGEAVAVDVAGRGDRAAAAVVRRHAAELEAVAAVEAWRGRGWRRSPRPCRTPHSSRRKRVPCGSAPLAPTIRSAKPSPLTSPAEATERPLLSAAAAPLSLKPLLPSRRREIDVGGKARGLAEHHVARAGMSLPCGSAQRSADDQVGEAVAVDVAGRGDRAAAVVARRRAAELEAVAAVEASRDRGWRQSPRPCRTPRSSRRTSRRAGRPRRRRRSGRRSRRR